MYAAVAAVALLCTSVDGNKLQPSSRTKAKWMWGDASALKLWVRDTPPERMMHNIAKHNPMRWSHLHILSETIASMREWQTWRRDAGSWAEWMRGDSPVNVYFEETGETWKFVNIEDAMLNLLMLSEGDDILQEGSHYNYDERNAGSHYKPIRCTTCSKRANGKHKYECCETTIKWMYADAGAKHFHKIAHMNPERWSRELNLREGIKSLQRAQAENRPVKVWMTQANGYVKYNSAAAAIEGLKTFLADEGELWRCRERIKWVWGDLLAIQKLNPNRWSGEANARQIITDLKGYKDVCRPVEVRYSKSETTKYYKSVEEAIEDLTTFNEREEQHLKSTGAKSEEL